MRLLIALLFGMFSGITLGQKQPVQLLDKPISIDVANKPISEVLTLIAKQSGVKFSYSPALIASERKVTLQLKNKPLRVVLERLLGDQVNIKSRNHFVILTPKPSIEPRKSAEATITGYVYNEQGIGLAYVSLYNKMNGVSCVTNTSGYFKLTCPNGVANISINVRKDAYKDTVIVLNNTMHKLEITLYSHKNKQVKEIEKEAVTSADTAVVSDISLRDTSSGKLSSDTVASPLNKLKSWFLSAETQANIKNISDTLFSKVQFSLIPQVSTNKLLVGNTVNAVSLSALIGYNRAVSVISVAGLLNVIAEDAGYASVAGIANVVGDSMYGVAIAGVSNINNGVVAGAQVSGVVNGCNQPLTGVQVAGIVNKATYYVTGSQVAGVINRLDGTLNGVQVAGLINAAQGNVDGLQVSGLLNVATQQIRGVQVSGLLNVANEVEGVQLGLMNFSGSIRGVPVGLFSFSKKGYHKLELFADESMHTQLAFRTGSLPFHNIFISGVDLTKRIDGLWNFGYGVGSFYKVSNKWNTGFEILAQSYLTNSSIRQAVWLYGFNYLFEKQFTPKFSIGFGPTLKLMHNPSVNNTVADLIAPYDVFKYVIDDEHGELRFWAGGKISIKIL